MEFIGTDACDPDSTAPRLEVEQVVPAVELEQSRLPLADAARDWIVGSSLRAVRLAPHASVAVRVACAADCGHHYAP